MTSGGGKARSVAVSRAVAAVFGLVYLVLGAAGATAAHAERAFARHGRLVGLFSQNPAHAYLYVFAGLFLLTAAVTGRLLRSVLLLASAGFLVLGVEGLVAHGNAHLNYLAENSADDLLHILTAIVLALAPLLAGRRPALGTGRRGPAGALAGPNASAGAAPGSVAVARLAAAAVEGAVGATALATPARPRRPAPVARREAEFDHDGRPVSPMSVEIADYLRIRPGWGWAILLAPILAGVAAVVILLAATPQFASAATVAVPALVGGANSNQFTGSSGSRAFFAEFQAIAKSPVVVQQVAAETGVTKSFVTGCITVSPVGANVTGNGTSSSPVALLNDTCTAAHKATASRVATADAKATLRYLFSTQNSVAGAALNSAQAELTAANNALASFEQANGALLDHSYADTELALHQTQQAEVNAINSKQTALEASLQSQANADSAKLAALAPKVAEYDSLAAAVNQARIRYNDTVKATHGLSEQLSVATSPGAVVTSPGHKVSRSTTVIKILGPAAAGGLFLVLIAMLLTELLRRSRRSPVLFPLELAR